MIKPIFYKSAILPNAQFATRFSPFTFKKTKKTGVQTTAHDFIDGNVGLQLFLNRTYKASLCSVLGCLTVAKIAAPLTIASPFGCLIGGMVVSIGGIVSFNKTAYSQIEDLIQKQKVLRTENSNARLLSYGLIVTGMGICMSPLIAFTSPVVLQKALLASCGVFAGASLYAYMAPHRKLLYLEGPLTGAVLGLVCLQFGGMAAGMMGYPALMASAFRADTFLGIGIFSALVAYDTHKAIQMYEEENPDHLQCSLDLFLDFINLFTRFVRIFRDSD